MVHYKYFVFNTFIDLVQITPSVILSNVTPLNIFLIRLEF